MQSEEEKETEIGAKEVQYPEIKIEKCEDKKENESSQNKEDIENNKESYLSLEKDEENDESFYSL